MLKGSLKSSITKNAKHAKMLESVVVHLILIIAVLITVYPVAWVIGVSFRDDNSLGGTKIFPDEPTLKNYNTVTSEKYDNGNSKFLVWLMNSLITSIGTTILGLVLATTAAYAYSRYDFKLKKTSMMSFLVVQMFPGVIILVPFYIMIATLGLMNSYIGLILMYSVTVLPLCVWMTKGFFDTIPKDLEEAAYIDGCSQFGAFWKIILPLSKPALAVTALFAFMSSWTEFILAYTFMTSDEMYTLAVGINQYVTPTHTEWGSFAAMAVLVSIPVVIMYIAFQKYLISGLTAGGVKG
jgi:arabinogalactan oligomer/maltooligosaccharide transport system permease protein